MRPRSSPIRSTVPTSQPPGALAAVRAADCAAVLAPASLGPPPPPLPPPPPPALPPTLPPPPTPTPSSRGADRRPRSIRTLSAASSVACHAGFDSGSSPASYASRRRGSVQSRPRLSIKRSACTSSGPSGSVPTSAAASRRMAGTLSDASISSTDRISSACCTSPTRRPVPPVPETESHGPMEVDDASGTCSRAAPREPRSAKCHGRSSSSEICWPDSCAWSVGRSFLPMAPPALVATVVNESRSSSSSACEWCPELPGWAMFCLF